MFNIVDGMRQMSYEIQQQQQQQQHQQHRFEFRDGMPYSLAKFTNLVMFAYIYRISFTLKYAISALCTNAPKTFIRHSHIIMNL